MDQTTPMPTAPDTTMPPAPTTPTPSAPAKKKDHWLVEIAGGIALGSTIMAALALWTVMVAQIFYA